MSNLILNNVDLKNYSWFNLGGKAKNFLNQIILMILSVF